MGLSNKQVGPKLLAKIQIYILTRAEFFLHFALKYPVLVFPPSNENTTVQDPGSKFSQFGRKVVKV